MYVLGVDHVMDMPFNDPKCADPADLWRHLQTDRRRREFARWNFDVANTDVLLDHFVEAERNEMQRDPVARGA